jgi:AraC-like DNA-binding protein
MAKTRLRDPASPTPAGLGRLTLRALRSTSRGLPASPLRVLGSYALIYLLEGHGRFEDELGRRQSVSAGDLMIVFPDVAHSYGPGAGGTWLESYIVFDGPVFDLWRSRGGIDPAQPVWRLEPIEYWERRFNGVLGVQRDERFVNHRVGDEDETAATQRVCLLQQFLADARAHQRDRTLGSHHHSWLEEAKAAIDRSAPAEPIDWDQLAGELAMSYETFRKRFAQLAGVPPARYRVGRLMDAACELLQREPHTKLRHIAQRLGFCDEFHFSRRFRQVVGMWPSEFRERIGHA